MLPHHAHSLCLRFFFRLIQQGQHPLFMSSFTLGSLSQCHAHIVTKRSPGAPDLLLMPSHRLQPFAVCWNMARTLETAHLRVGPTHCVRRWEDQPQLDTFRKKEHEKWNHIERLYPCIQTFPRNRQKSNVENKNKFDVKTYLYMHPYLCSI